MTDTDSTVSVVSPDSDTDNDEMDEATTGTEPKVDKVEQDNRDDQTRAAQPPFGNAYGFRDQRPAAAPAGAGERERD